MLLRFGATQLRSVGKNAHARKIRKIRAAPPSAAQPACTLALPRATVTDTKHCAPRALRALPRHLALASWLSWLQWLASRGRACQLGCRQLLPGCTWQQDLVHLRVRFSREQAARALFFPFFWTCLDFSARYIEELASWITRLPF
jgi:hypothetical protein